MAAGRVQSRSNLRSITVDSIYTNLGKNLCKALPDYHTFTGSDFKPFSNQKGKIQPLKKLEKDVQAQIVSGHLGELDDDQKTILQKLKNLHIKCTVRKI